MELERRAIAREVRAEGSRLIGYAATFNSIAKIGQFHETIIAGAFTRSLDENPDILALMDHDASKVLGRTKTQTLRLKQDATGLAFELDLPDTQAGHDVRTLAERGDLGGMSFGFKIEDDTWAGKLRLLKAVDLREISVVSAWPAYEGTSVSLRSIALGRERHRRERGLILAEVARAVD